MKKFYNLFFIIIIGLSVAIIATAFNGPTGGNPPNGGGVLYYFGGNIGIGTTTPSVSLEVYGRIKDKTGYLAPIGTISMFGASAAPSGWLLCNGAAISRTTYADLFAVIGTTYGAGDGSTTFKVPNLQGVFPRGVGSQTIGAQTFTGILGTITGDLTALPNTAFTTGTESATHNHTTDIGSHSHTQTGREGGGTDRDDPDTQTGQGVSLKAAGSTQTTTIGNKTSGNESATHTHTVTSGGDSETAPANLGVNFIIKY